MKTSANDIKGKVTKDTVREKYRESRDLSRQVKHIVKEVRVVTHAIKKIVKTVETRHKSGKTQ